MTRFHPLHGTKPVQDYDIDQEFQEAQRYYSVRFSNNLLFIREGFSWAYIPIKSIERAWARLRFLRSTGCCSGVPQPCVVITYDNESEILEMLNMGKAAEFVQLLHERAPELIPFEPQP